MKVQSCSKCRLRGHETQRLDGQVVRHVGIGVGGSSTAPAPPPPPVVAGGLARGPGGVAGGSRERGVGFGLAGLGAEPPPLSDLPSFGGVAVEEGYDGGEAACRSVQPQAAGVARVCDVPVCEPPPPPLPG